MELEITWGRTIQVWWAYVWRNLIAILVAMIVGMGVGAIIGFVMGTIGCSMNAIQIVTGLIGFVIGVVISVFPMKMILGKILGSSGWYYFQRRHLTAGIPHPHHTNYRSEWERRLMRRWITRCFSMLAAALARTPPAV